MSKTGIFCSVNRTLERYWGNTSLSILWSNSYNQKCLVGSGSEFYEQLPCTSDSETSFSGHPTYSFQLWLRSDLSDHQSLPSELCQQHTTVASGRWLQHGQPNHNGYFQAHHNLHIGCTGSQCVGMIEMGMILGARPANLRRHLGQAKSLYHPPQRWISVWCLFQFIWSHNQKVTLGPHLWQIERISS